MKIIIVLPVYNEEVVLAKNAEKVLVFCQKHLKEGFKIVIADNDSTDNTSIIGRVLSLQNSNVDFLKLEAKGKGLAVKTAWEKYDADIYCFMDADLATDLSALPELIKAVKAGNDLAMGSRFHPDSRVTRSLSRKIISYGYRLAAKMLVKVKAQDLPCGFKAVSRKFRDEVLPQVKNRTWFFDSELVILAQRQGYKIKEIPVIWSEGKNPKRKSRVGVFKVALYYLVNLCRMRWLDEMK